MSDFINVSNDIAKATLAASGSAVMYAGKSMLVDGVIYISDGTRWDPISAATYTSATLPATSNLPVGEEVYLSDVNGFIKYAGAVKQCRLVQRDWTALMATVTTNLPEGTTCQVTDYGYNTWEWRGGFWKPASNKVTLYQKYGLNDGTNYIAQVSGATTAPFVIPGGLKIPTRMIVPNSQLVVQSEVTKVGANAVATVLWTAGTLNTISDNSFHGQNFSIATGMQALSSAACRFGTSTTKYNSRDYQGEGVSVASLANVMKDRTNNINTEADMFLNIFIKDANALDVFNLIGYRVVLETV